jgi:hypothetical protein
MCRAIMCMQHQIMCVQHTNTHEHMQGNHVYAAQNHACTTHTRTHEHMQGKCTYADGARYEGELRDGEIHGTG